MPIRFAMDAEQYIRDHDDLMCERIEAHKEAERLINEYSNVLSAKERTQALLMRWDACNVMDYRRKFLYLILEGYRVWEMSAKNLEQRYECIVVHNPEWTKHFSTDYYAKVKRCKVQLPYEKKEERVNLTDVFKRRERISVCA